MKSSRTAIVSSLFLLGALVCPSAAQTPRVERPYRGLFGGGVGDAEQLLTAQGSVGGGYDDNVFADSGVGGGSSDPRTAQGASFGQFAGSLSYSVNRRRVGFSGNAAASSRYLPDFPTKFMTIYGGGVGASWQATRSTTITANQTAHYQPFLTLNLFPQLFDPPLGTGQLPSHDWNIGGEAYWTYASTVGVSQGLSSRTSINAFGGYHRTDGEREELNRTQRSAGGGIRHNVARGLGVRAGYGYTDGRYPGRLHENGGLEGHTFDGGVDYNRALSFSRRTTLSFATGTSAIRYQDQVRYYLTGNARLNREIGRTWNGGVAYSRNVGFIERFSEPFVSDSVMASFGGLINRRTQFHSSAGASFGTVGLTGEGNNYDTYTGGVGLTVAITRYLGLNTTYAYYRYRFDDTVVLPPGISRNMSRQSVQANLAVWVPLMYRARRPDAPR